MTTDELKIFSEGDITLDDTCAHKGSCLVAIDGVLGEL
jgi:hypothetical protein